MIYAIRAVGTDYIKIGYTTEDLLRTRLSTLQIGCPFELELIAAGPGTISEEQQIHVLLTAAGRYFRGEWFVSSPETDQVIERLKAHRKPEVKMPPMVLDRKSKLARILEYAEELTPIERRRRERLDWWKLHGDRIS